MVGIVIEVSEKFPVLLLPVSELGCHGHKLSEVKGYVWCFFGPHELQRAFPARFPGDYGTFR
jgi:hypothetical protein